MKSQARLSVRSINQSNRSISVRLSFLFCSRAFISRSYENRSNNNNNDHPRLLFLNCLYGEAPSERSASFRLQVYERVEISLLEEYEMIGKSFILVCKLRPKAKGLIRRYILGCKKVEKTSCFFKI